MVERPRVLIVGGAGYLGARLAQELSATMHVVVTYRSESPARRAWLDRHAPKITGIAFDSAKQDSIPCGGVFSAVINLALPGAEESARDPEGTMRSALATTNACLNLLNEKRAGRLIQFSTFHVYGPPVREVYDENTEAHPQHPYGKNHLACERLIQSSSCADDSFIVRPTNGVAAPAHGDLGPQAKLLFLDLCRQAAQENRITLDNDGLSYRAFVPFDDVLNAMHLLLKTDRPEHGARPMNLSAGSAYRLDEVAGQIRDAALSLFGRKPELNFGTGTDAFRNPFTVSNAALCRLGWKPQANLKKEIIGALRFFAPE